MGKASRIKRERNGQPPAGGGQTYCAHCLEILHDGERDNPITEALTEAYRDMREGTDCDRQYSHEEALDWIEGEVGTILSALKSSGERYHRDHVLESKAMDWGDYHYDPENTSKPEPWTREEIDDYQGVVEREEAREERREAAKKSSS